MFELVCLYDFGDFGSSHQELFYKKGFVKIFAKFTVKHLCWSTFFKKNWLREEKKKGSSTGNFSWVLPSLSEVYWRTSADGWHKEKVLWRSSVIVKLLSLRFKLILLIILKLLNSWYFVTILRSFGSGLFSI